MKSTPLSDRTDDTSIMDRYSRTLEDPFEYVRAVGGAKGAGTVDGGSGVGVIGRRSAPPASTAPSKVSPSLFPTFGDFLPPFKATAGPHEEIEDKWGGSVGLGLFSSRVREEEERRNRAVESMAFPFQSLSLDSPVSNGFTFHPSTAFSQIGSSSLSPTSSPTSYFSNTSRPPPTHTQSYSHSSPQRSPTYPTLSRKPSFPLTPPRSRSSSLSHHHHPQAQSTSPPIYHSPTASKRVTQLSPLPASFVPGIKGLTSTIPSPTSKSLDGGEQPYPLSAADTNRVAQLHEGRIPTLAQLAPPDLSTTAGGASTAAIINTGNVGPMIVQTGDWKCGCCSFVNWRRRKICMRCFPYASDIGSVINIQSIAAVALERTTSNPGPSPSRTASIPMSQSRSQIQAIAAQQLYYQSQLQSPSSATYTSYQPHFFHPQRPSPPPTAKPFDYPVSPPPAPPSSLYPAIDLKTYYSAPSANEDRIRRGRYAGKGSEGRDEGVLFFPAIGA